MVVVWVAVWVVICLRGSLFRLFVCLFGVFVNWLIVGVSVL